MEYFKLVDNIEVPVLWTFVGGTYSILVYYLANIGYRKNTDVYPVCSLLFLTNLHICLIIINFDYPDILRQPTEVILARFQAGGESLILTWFAFAWIGLPLLFAMIMLQKILERENNPYPIVGTVSGVIGGIAQIIGLLRWSFIVSLTMFRSELFKPWLAWFGIFGNITAAT
ncbi:DUF4386 family protein [Leptospira ilyithenensis]|uniref:DUF4386 family protein n=1 Tax=Leptospira ilyithenensis TaxID=2484901 RepID=A0A4R9LUL1_9LEPT|nr:DUF4386 family protein [Leptospira ilyithenensis]TGN14068.1 DUF4386 family protein [Leptospira ilyithenensis]